ncbi:MAG: PHP-associated domain-containing protein [Candidatus ainarchaeum sp.]|nr:PHP-associated domain-containing protein [Candidatus ainarchaeum sp.]
MLFDLHLHSRYSVDALTKPETIVKIMKKNKFGFSLTDHNNVDAYTKGKITQLAKKEGVFLIPGEEIKVLENTSSDAKCVGEVIGYFLQKEIKPSTFESIFDQIKEQDALLSCPHPFDWPRKNFKEFPSLWKKFDAMEVYNARAYYQGLNKKSVDFFETVAKGKIAPLANSDAHTPEELGNGLTEIDAENETEFRKAIKKRQTIPIPMGKANLWHHFQTQMARKHWMKER